MSTESESQFEVDGVKLYAKTWTVGTLHSEPEAYCL